MLMAQDYHYGGRVEEINEGTRSITKVSTALVGMVCTGDDADPSVFSLNKPVLLTDVLTASGNAGESGTLARSLDAIANQAKPVTAPPGSMKCRTPSRPPVNSCRWKTGRWTSPSWLSTART